MPHKYYPLNSQQPENPGVIPPFLQRHPVFKQFLLGTAIAAYHGGIQFLDYLGFTSKASQGFEAESVELNQLRGLNVTIPVGNSSSIISAGDLFCDEISGDYLAPFSLSQELLERVSTKHFVELFDAQTYYGVFCFLTGLALACAAVQLALLLWKRHTPRTAEVELALCKLSPRNVGQFPRTAFAVTLSPIFIYALLDFWLAKWVGIAEAARQFCNGVDLSNPYGHSNGVIGVEDEYNDIVATAMFFGKAALQALSLPLVGYLITVAIVTRDALIIAPPVITPPDDQEANRGKTEPNLLARGASKLQALCACPSIFRNCRKPKAESLHVQEKESLLASRDPDTDDDAADASLVPHSRPAPQP